MVNQPLPREVVNEWPEILEGQVISAVPLGYLRSFKIIFKNGSEWDLLTEPKADEIQFANNVQELISYYRDAIDSIDFQLNITKIQKDANKVLRKFLKI